MHTWHNHCSFARISPDPTCNTQHVCIKSSATSAAPKGTLPDRQHTPVISQQLAHHPDIPRPVAGQLGQPELRIACRNPGQVASMPMPKTAIDKNSNLPAGQDHIRLAGQALAAAREPETQGVQRLADLDLGLGVAATDASHHPAAGGWVDRVSHALSRRPGLQSGGMALFSQISR